MIVMTTRRKAEKKPMVLREDKRQDLLEVVVCVFFGMKWAEFQFMNLRWV